MFSSHNLEGMPMTQMLDPPFRKISAEDETAVRTVIHFLRIAWKTKPPESFAVSGDGETVPSAGDEAVWAFITKCSHMPADEQEALPQAEKEDTFTPWRNAVYPQWAHVFFDVANFLWDVNGTTIGHWHVDDAKANPDKAFGQLVLYHGQMNDAALEHRFSQNVLIAPAFLDVGVQVRSERLPMKAEESETGYTLDERIELDTLGHDKQSGDTIWFFRRDVPYKFFVEPAARQDGEGEVVDRTGVAAVLIYGNLCLDLSHMEERFAQE